MVTVRVCLRIPQFVAYSDLAHLNGKMIACTQPRRVAAISAAKRVAEEMDVQLGYQVGYSIRFEDMTKRGTTFLKYMTDGMLLREAMDDPDLRRYSTVILDEAHERTIATDILMGLLKGLAKRRADLKIIIMSARSTPPPIRGSWSYTSGGDILRPRLRARYVEAAIRTVLMIHRAEGPVIFFCSSLTTSSTKIPHPWAQLSAYHSIRPNQSCNNSVSWTRPAARGPRKVVVSTNIAETSLTIDGIVYVVDPGFSKQKVYNPRIRVESLLVSPISKASAQQRAGRAGRTRPGKCFRLYTERDFCWHQGKTECIQFILLSDIVVQDLVRFEYLDVPAPESLMRALELLNFLKALDDDGNLTPLGSKIAEFPLEPQLATLLVVSPEFKCSNEILTIVSMISVPNIRVRPADQKNQADAAKTRFTVSDGDHLTLLNVYNQYMQSEPSSHRRRVCAYANFGADKSNENWPRTNFVSGRALAEAEKVRAQLQRLMKRSNLELISITDEKKLHQSIRQALVCGFFMQAAHREGEKGSYVTIKDNQVVYLHPSSGLKGNPEWVLFNEFILTTKPYIRTVPKLLELAPSYFDLSSFPDGETKRRLRKVMRKVQQSRQSNAYREASSHSSGSTALYTSDDVVAMLTQMSTSTSAFTLEDAIARFKEMSL
ncbi:DEAH-box ATP-dependent RNA helicase [Salix suchowensis]|nr:DEAH-box ATP-dependent RNA helicase [Salix suchowensis]